MDVELSWLKIRAELVAVVLALALLRVHALDLAPVVAPVPVPGVPGARVVAALKDPEARAEAAPSLVDVPKASPVRVRQESRAPSPGRDPSLMKSLLTEKGPSLERNLWIRDVTAATVCRSRAPVRSR